MLSASKDALAGGDQWPKPVVSAAIIAHECPEVNGAISAQFMVIGSGVLEEDVKSIGTSRF